MIKANFSAYDTYVTDSLYQWDINQVLSVAGLNLAVAPEVHFSNANMDKAIVRQSTLNNHIVSVQIPNSLLQDPLTIKAHIGIYEGSTFKVIELVEIPVIPKPRPADYVIENTDQEIYSFEALRNALANKATNARVDNIIAHNNDTEGNTELLDIRTGADDTVYTSAGDAVRSQIMNIDDVKLDKVDSIKTVDGDNLLLYDHFKTGFYYSADGVKVVGANAGYYPPVKVTPNTVYTNSRCQILCIFDENMNFIESDTTVTINKTFTTPSNAGYIIVSESLVNFGKAGLYLGEYKGAYVKGEKLISINQVKGLTDIAKPVIHIGLDYEYDSILEALKDNTDKAVIYYIHSGIYDIEAEYIDVYGGNYFNTYSGYSGNTDLFYRGLNLCDGSELIGVGDVTLTFNYSGDNESVKKYFSPINTTQNNRIENISLVIGDNSCRYGIHDDFATDGGVNVFDNCYFSGASYLNTFIGGGFGEANIYKIIDCVFDNAGGLNIAYHNNENSGSKNKLTIENCYCNGSIRGGMYGASTEISLMIVTNCKALSISCVLTDTTGTYTNENIKLIAWNNELTS